MKKTIFAAAIICAAFTGNAEVIVDDFEANSFGWNECAFESNNGSAIIDKGVLTVTSKGEKKALGAFMTAMSGVKTQIGEDTFFETHCYAPIDMSNDFTISADVTIDKLASDKTVGMIFNYKDDGNFYCFTFNNEMVRFTRYVDNAVVGGLTQGVIWEDKKKTQQQWILSKQGDELAFSVDGMEILRVRYMPLQYSGFGFYTFGKQKLIVEKVTFQQ